jgi:RNA polymerase sigma-70 factor, ECF subfamily
VIAIIARALPVASAVRHSLAGAAGVNDSCAPIVDSDDREVVGLMGELVAHRVARPKPAAGGPVAERLVDRERVGAPAGVVGASAAARIDAFRRLVDRELDGAYRLAAVILDDRLEAEDAVHDAALAAWRRFDDLRDRARFDAWFARILVNGCRDRLRTRARRRIVDLGRELVEAEHPPVTDGSDAVAVRDLLDRALEALTPDERVVIGLRYDTDLTVPAIAAMLAIPEGTVKSRLHHALGRLRAAIEERES